MSRLTVHRRKFLAATGAGSLMIVSPSAVWSYSRNEKLNCALVAVGGRGGAHIGCCAGQNFIAMAECDERQMAGARKQYPQTKAYTDYRKLFDAHKDLNAVFVGTPDHHHFPASMRAIDVGAGVYTEKPLTYSVWEARRLAEFARKKKVATQLGNQGHSGEGCRRLCELVWGGVLGDVTEVHCRTNWAFSAGIQVAKEPQKVPAGLDWDVWCGPAPMRPYQGGIHPFSWRGWFDYGTGALGDQGCHVMDAAFWALKLAEADSVEVSAETSEDNGPLYPLWSIVTYKFPARAGMVPLTLKWFLGNKLPPRPPQLEPERGNMDHGTYYYGTKGVTFTDQYCGGARIIPESKHKETKYPAPTLPRAKHGHQEAFLNACKGGEPACSNFDYSGPLAEIVLLGDIATRIKKPFTFRLKELKAVNCPEADALVKREPRKGWEFGYGNV
ncbi:MAG: Gfo/Idh/MocA family oxidoreductase [Thermoguttaceae bacterium]